MEKLRLIKGWEFFKGRLGGVWEVWRRNNDSNDYFLPWEKVELPHCFNAFDSVDPDIPYYQGEGWYCNKLEVKNPYPHGRTLLHFEGAGQLTDIFVGSKMIGSHLGGYDEFSVDITNEIPQSEIAGSKVILPIAIRCDNSRNLETISRISLVKKLQ